MTQSASFLALLLSIAMSAASAAPQPSSSDKETSEVANEATTQVTSHFTTQGTTKGSPPVLPGAGWSACLKAMKVSDLNPSERELDTRDLSAKNLRDALSTYLTPNGQIDRELLKRNSPRVSFDLGTPEILRFRNVMKDLPKKSNEPIDQIIKITRDTSGNIIALDVSNRLGGTDVLNRVRRALNADERGYFFANFKFDPKAGANGDQCLMTRVDGDVSFDYGYCRTLEAIQNQQGACDSACAKPMLSEFRDPVLLNPKEYDGLRLRSQHSGDYRSLARHLFMDLCSAVYANYRLPSGDLRSNSAAEESSSLEKARSPSSGSSRGSR